MDDTSLRAPVLDIHRYSGFRPLRTIWVVSCLLLFLLTVEFITLAYVFVFTDSPVRCDLYYMIIYAEICIWFTFFIVRLYINTQHKMYLMARNYFEFYKKFNMFIELPFQICSCSLAVLLAITCLYVQYAIKPQHDFFCETEYYYSPIVVVTTALTIQNLLLIPLFSVYIVIVDDFNKERLPPDSEIGNQYMPGTLGQAMYSDETGYRERGEPVDNMLEKQADLIRYYKEANEILNKKLFDLTSEGRGIIDPVI